MLVLAKSKHAPEGRATSVVCHLPRLSCMKCSAILFFCSLLLAGCVVDPNANDPWSSRGGGGRAVTDASATGDSTLRSSFDPESMRVHPLSHVDVAPDGVDGAALLVHVELRDRFGDAVKGVGKLRVELSRGADTSAGDSPAAAWDVADLLDPESGSRRFDPSTRTYRLPLLAPAWLLRAVKEDRPHGGRPRVRVTFLPTGSSRVLADEMVLE